MATKDTTKAAKTWDDALEKKFLLEIIHELGTTVPKSAYEKIAARWGEPHTTGSLTIKFFRMKEKVKKELGPGSGEAPAKPPAKAAPKKRKAGKDADAAGTEGEEGAGKKAKKTKVTKAKSTAKGEKQVDIEDEVKDEDKFESDE